MRRLICKSSSLPDLIANRLERFVTDRSRDRCLNRCGEYSKVHIRVIQSRQQKNRHPIRYNPEQVSFHLVIKAGSEK